MSRAIFNQGNIDLVDIHMNPILEITPKGMKTKDKEYDLDVLILATGFETHTGAFMSLDLCGVDGETIQEHWRDGTTTYLGMTIDNFPNLYFVHGPQGPAPCNALTCVEIQGSWVIQMIEYLCQHGITKFTPTFHAALTYKRHIDALFNATLFPLVNSANISDLEKKCTAHNYFGGLPAYKREITEEIEHGYLGFEGSAKSGSPLALETGRKDANGNMCFISNERQSGHSSSQERGIISSHNGSCMCVS